jgi:4-hydroxy-2-oxoglutarate aldolase
MTLMNFRGVLNPVPTVFDRDGEVDLVRFREALRRWVASPLSGFVILGSTGEAAFLDEDESERIIAAGREVVPSDRALVAGTGRESTRAAVNAAKRAAALGADAVLVRTPGFYKGQMTIEAHVRHYTAVADASPVPVLLYNFTAVTGVTIPVAAVSTLASHPNIIGMKESNGDVPRIAELVSAVPDTFSVLAGSASTFLGAIGAGVRGGILALSAVLPEGCVRLLDLARAGRDEEARALQAQLLPAAKLFGATYGIPGLKAALNLLGYDVGDPRPPLVRVNASAVAEIVEALSPFPEATLHAAP